MTDIAVTPELIADPSHKPWLDVRPSMATAIVFILLLCAGIGYGAYGLVSDIRSVQQPWRWACSACWASRC